MLRTTWGSRSPHQIPQRHTEDAGDPQQRVERRVVLAGFDALQDVATDAGVEVEAFLRDALTTAFAPDPVPQDAAVLVEPGVVVGWVHSTNAELKIITSQPDKSGILEGASPAYIDRTFE